MAIDKTVREAAPVNRQRFAAAPNAPSWRDESLRYTETIRRIDSGSAMLDSAGASETIVWLLPETIHAIRRRRLLTTLIVNGASVLGTLPVASILWSISHSHHFMGNMESLIYMVWTLPFLARIPARRLTRRLHVVGERRVRAALQCIATLPAAESTVALAGLLGVVDGYGAIPVSMRERLTGSLARLGGDEIASLPASTIAALKRFARIRASWPDRRSLALESLLVLIARLSSDAALAADWRFHFGLCLRARAGKSDAFRDAVHEWREARKTRR